MDHVAVVELDAGDEAANPRVDLNLFDRLEPAGESSESVTVPLTGCATVTGGGAAAAAATAVAAAGQRDSQRRGQRAGRTTRRAPDPYPLS